MSVYEVLDLVEVGGLCYKFICCLGVYFFDSIEHVFPHVFISVMLKDFARELLLLKLNGVNEVAEVTA